MSGFRKRGFIILMNKKTQFKTSSPALTQALGEKIGALLKAGDVVALEGELGAGKTTLVKGIARGLGVKDKSTVVSPTYVLVNEYEGREKVYHIDWYRLDAVKGLDRQMARECFDSDAVSLVEWAGRGRTLLPSERINISLRHAGPLRRIITVSAKRKRYRDFVKLLESLS